MRDTCILSDTIAVSLNLWWKQEVIYSDLTTTHGIINLQKLSTNYQKVILLNCRLLLTMTTARQFPLESKIIVKKKKKGESILRIKFHIFFFFLFLFSRKDYSNINVKLS